MDTGSRFGGGPPSSTGRRYASSMARSGYPVNAFCRAELEIAQEVRSVTVKSHIGFYPITQDHSAPSAKGR